MYCTCTVHVYIKDSVLFNYVYTTYPSYGISTDWSPFIALVRSYIILPGLSHGPYTENSLKLTALSPLLTA